MGTHCDDQMETQEFGASLRYAIAGVNGQATDTPQATTDSGTISNYSKILSETPECKKSDIDGLINSEPKEIKHSLSSMLMDDSQNCGFVNTAVVDASQTMLCMAQKQVQDSWRKKYSRAIASTKHPVPPGIRALLDKGVNLKSAFTEAGGDWQKVDH